MFRANICRRNSKLVKMSLATLQNKEYVKTFVSLRLPPKVSKETLKAARIRETPK